ncbi:MAG: hypothetical protein KAS72_15760 [Phycisphaerales bacterium]|nr:hypothetical protein [Phycisphaerales bacterium]
MRKALRYIAYGIGSLAVAAGVCSTVAGCAADAPMFAPPVEVGRVDSPLVMEASGLAASRTNAGLLYVHNDSGDTARVFVMDATAHVLAILNLADVDVLDCEDMTVGPGPMPNVSYIYLGDIGDNAAKRERIFIYRFPEPRIEPSDRPTPAELLIRDLERIELQYEDGPHNAEALMVDPFTGDLFIASKALGTTTIYTASADDLSTDSVVILHPMVTISIGAGGIITGGDISPAGDQIILRTYTGALLWKRGEACSIAKVFKQPSRLVPAATEPQGEAITFDATGRGYYTVSEGKHPPLHHVARIAPTDDSEAPGKDSPDPQHTSD